MNEQRPGATGKTDRGSAYSGDVPDTPADRDEARIVVARHRGPLMKEI